MIFVYVYIKRAGPCAVSELQPRSVMRWSCIEEYSAVTFVSKD